MRICLLISRRKFQVDRLWKLTLSKCGSKVNGCRFPILNDAKSEQHPHGRLSNNTNILLTDDEGDQSYH
eukprot:scaffold1292_cov199-Amphora_coffeaeformis.AAC.1